MKGYSFRKTIRKEAAKMYLARSSVALVKAGWKVAFLIEEYGLPRTLANKRSGKNAHQANAAYKQFHKFQRFALKGVQAEEVVKSPKAFRLVH